MTKSGTRYTTDELRFLDWVSNQINTKLEMYQIAPTIAKIMYRTESGIVNCIERRKEDAGHKEFYWARS